VEESDLRRTLDPDILFRVPSVFNYDISPKDDQVAFSWNKSGQWQIYARNLSAATVRQLTSGNESKISPRFSPDQRRLTYVQDYQGDENFDIFLMELENGETRNLTPDTNETIYPSIRWSPNAKRLAFASNRKRKFSIYTMPSTGGDPEQIVDHEYSDSDPKWSPDGKWLAFNAFVTAQDFGAFVVPAAGGEVRRLTEGDRAIEASSPEWSPDGNRIAFMSAEHGSYDIGVWDLRSGSVDWITNGRYEYYEPRWSPDGRKLAYLVNKDGNVGIAIRNNEDGSVNFLEVESGVHMQLQFGHDSETLFFTFSGPRHPPDLWMLNLEGRTFDQLTQSLPDTIDRSEFVSPSSIRYTSDDGLDVPALLYVPRDFSPLNPRPSLIYIHGGPTAQQMNEWYPSIQHLVSRGYVVVAPNYRGSTGFGRKYREANRFVLGDGDLKDVVRAADYLVEHGLADLNGVGVLGGSYGGYLTMCALTKYPERWAVGSATVPFLNWFTEIENEREDLQYWDRQNMGHPEKDYERFREASPIFFLDRIRAPVQLIGGAHDPRCPVSEIDQAKRELQKLGKPFDLVIYEDEGHGFRRLDNRVDAYKRRATFLERYLPPKQTGS
jgi:dipeptidyl aminopeptidase/acylaminoacyl peptidase